MKNNRITKRNKKFIMVLCSISVFLFIILIGPMDIFTHGYFCDEVNVDQIDDIDKMGTINITDKAALVKFVPKKRHFAGFEIFLVNQKAENRGTLLLSVYDVNDNLADKIEIELSKIKDSVWYKAYSNVSLVKGEEYTLTFDVAGNDSIPSMMLVNKDYLPKESILGNVLIGYAYSKPTFKFQEKFIIVMFILSLWETIMYFLLGGYLKQNYIHIAAIFTFLSAVLSWNYMFNSMDNQNTGFANFQADSETLVSGTIYAEWDGIYFLTKEEKGYGLGRYRNVKGTLYSYGLSYISDDNWLDGYNRTASSIVVNSNDITKKIAKTGNYIRFKNGEEFQIKEVNDDGSNIVIALSTDRLLSRARNGSLDDTVFFDINHKEIDKSLITAYKSQYGLQGKIFRHMTRHMNKDEAIVNLNLFCSVAAAMVFTAITILIAVKYNYLLAGCFYVTFWLSPWIVNFARNLYWVEFTWFIPMAVGLFCAWKVHSKVCRIFSYISAFTAITIKCLCGYEYISVIMMALVSFLVIELLMAMVNRERDKSKLLFKTILTLSAVAIAGFMTAICIHAPLKGNGSLIDGIQNIIEKDVLRRTNGADLNDFNSIYWPSMNASIWEVYSRYFHFSTEVITGITGNLFALLCLMPLAIFVYEYIKYKKIEYYTVFAYVFFFLTSISWFCLAKSHSYIHVHMNYVLWYFGFVQTCFYVIVNKIVNVINGR